MKTNDKISIELSNPFAESGVVTCSIEDIRKIDTTVEFKSDNGIIVALPDGDSSLLTGLNEDDISIYNLGDSISVYADTEGNICKANDKYEIYKSVLSKANKGCVFSGKVIDSTKQGLLVDVDGGSEIDDMFADTWNHLHRTVIENIHLYHLILPEFVL